MRGLVGTRSPRVRYRLTVAAAIAALPGYTWAGTTHGWIVGSGNWNTAGNWTPVGVPGSGDTAFIVDVDGLKHVVTYNGNSNNLHAIDLNNTGGGSDILSMMGSGVVLGADAENIGGYFGSSGSGIGQLAQSLGVNTVNGQGNRILG